MPAEAALAKPLAQPRQPTAQEVREHQLTHLPYRSWWRHCVRGKGKSLAHRQLEAEATHEVPHVSLDYAFISCGRNTESTPYQRRRRKMPTNPAALLSMPLESLVARCEP